MLSKLTLLTNIFTQVKVYPVGRISLTVQVCVILSINFYFTDFKYLLYT